MRPMVIATAACTFMAAGLFGMAKFEAARTLLSFAMVAILVEIYLTIKDR